MVHPAQWRRLRGQSHRHARRHGRHDRLVDGLARPGRSPLPDLVPGGALRSLHERERPGQSPQSKLPDGAEALGCHSLCHRERRRPQPREDRNQFHDPEDVGFDMARFHAPNVGTIVAANGVSLMLNPPPGVPNFKAPAFMIHFIREVSGGIEYRTRFWMGYHILNRKPWFLLPGGVRIPEFVPRGLAIHNVCEYTNLGSFLPQLYEEQNGVI